MIHSRRGEVQHSLRSQALSKEKTIEVEGTTRRDLLRSAVYVTPVILTLAATPSFAKKGTGKGKRDDWDDDWD
jgi:hypothetical protein